MYCKCVFLCYFFSVILKKKSKVRISKKRSNVRIPEIFRKFSKGSSYERVIWPRGPENRFHLSKVPVIEGSTYPKKLIGVC